MVAQQRMGGTRDFRRFEENKGAKGRSVIMNLSHLRVHLYSAMVLCFDVTMLL